MPAPVKYVGKSVAHFDKLDWGTYTHLRLPEISDTTKYLRFNNFNCTCREVVVGSMDGVASARSNRTLYFSYNVNTVGPSVVNVIKTLRYFSNDVRKRFEEILRKIILHDDDKAEFSFLSEIRKNSGTIKIRVLNAKEVARDDDMSLLLLIIRNSDLFVDALIAIRDNPKITDKEIYLTIIKAMAERGKLELLCDHIRKATYNTKEPFVFGRASKEYYTYVTIYPTQGELGCGILAMIVGATYLSFLANDQYSVIHRCVGDVRYSGMVSKLTRAIKEFKISPFKQRLFMDREDVNAAFRGTFSKVPALTEILRTRVEMLVATDEAKYFIKRILEM